jgi:hypothetical protein
VDAVTSGVRRRVFLAARIVISARKLNSAMISGLQAEDSEGRGVADSAISTTLSG